MSTVATGISSTEGRFGGVQRKIAFLNQRWYVVYLNGNHIYYKKSTNATGTSWNSAIKLSDVANSFNPSLHVNGNKIWVMWWESSDDWMKYRSIDTSNSDALGAIYNTPDSGGYGNDNYGNLFIDGAIKYLHHDDDPNVYKTTNDTSFSSIEPSILDRKSSGQFAKSGSNVWLIYGPSGFFDDYIRAIPYNGSSWGSAVDIESSNMDVEYGSGISVASKGNNIYVLYNKGGTIRVSKYDGTNWFALTGDVSTSGDTTTSKTNGLQAVSITIDDNTEDIYVFYRKTDNKIYYRKCADADSATQASPAVTWGTETDTGVATSSVWISSPRSNTERLGIVALSGTSLEFTDLGQLTTETVAYEDRSFRLAAEGVGYEDRSFRMKVDEINYEDRNFRITLYSLDYEDRSFRLKADEIGYGDRNFILTMSTDGYEDRTFRAKVDEINYEDRSIHLSLEETTYEDRNFFLRVGDQFDGYEDRNFRLVLRSTDYEDRSVIIKVDEIAYEDRVFRLGLEETAYSDRSFRLSMQQEGYGDARFYLRVSEIDYGDRNFQIGVLEQPGVFPDYEDRGFHLGLEGDQWIDEGDKVDTYTDTTDSTNTWTDTTDNTDIWTDTT